MIEKDVPPLLGSACLAMDSRPRLPCFSSVWTSKGTFTSSAFCSHAKHTASFARSFFGLAAFQVQLIKCWEVCPEQRYWMPVSASILDLTSVLSFILQEGGRSPSDAHLGEGDAQL